MSAPDAPTLVLGIESSCDETAAAVVRSDGRVLSDVVASQIALHAPYGGVVPELASRAHLESLHPVIEAALQPVEGGLDGIDAVAVTAGPGLMGALLIGVQAAKAIAWSRGLPLIGVDHLEAHLLAAYLIREDEEKTEFSSSPELPYIALLASGGHTAIYELRSSAEIELLGQTRDDAAGEAFDKVAKLLGLGYPGGPVIDRLAKGGDPKAVPLPMPMPSRQRLAMSFSGLKTAVARHVEVEGRPPTEQGLADLCASFQAVVVELLLRKSLAACRQRGVPRLVLGGGVAANRGLRALAASRCAEAGVTLTIPPLRSCTDNGAMIAYAGARKLARGERDGLGLGVYSRSPLVQRGKFPKRERRAR